MMTFSRLIAGLLTVFLLFGVSSNAQKMHTTTMELDADQVFIIPGLGAIISQENDTLKVLMVPPAEGRSKEFKNVNLEQGDIILMCNGKRTKTVEALKEAIEPVAIGADLKFGIRRDGKMIMTSLPKAKAEDMTNMKVMTMTSGGEGSEDETSTMTTTSRGKTVTRTMHGSGDMVPVRELGALLGTQNGSVVMIGLIDNIKLDLEHYTATKGDVITSINGRSVSSASDFDRIHKAIEEGEQITLKVDRDGKLFTLWLTKQANLKGMKKRRKN